MLMLELTRAKEGRVYTILWLGNVTTSYIVLCFRDSGMLVPVSGW